MPLSFPLRRALANAHQPGAWLTLPSTPVAYTLASTPGLDWVCIDGEHGLISGPSLRPPAPIEEA
jgi:4-hydroxy-2-oxoheptanedioate aldolase